MAGLSQSANAPFRCPPGDVLFLRQLSRVPGKPFSVSLPLLMLLAEAGFRPVVRNDEARSRSACLAGSVRDRDRDVGSLGRAYTIRYSGQRPGAGDCVAPDPGDTVEISGAGGG